MKQKKQMGVNHMSTGMKKQPAGVKKKTPGVNISMMGTEKVARETVIALCTQVISQSNTLTGNDNKEQNKKNNAKGNKKNDPKTFGKPKQNEVKGKAMNYKVLKELRKKQAETEAAAKKAAEADNERVSAREGPREITAKMIKAAKEKDGHKQGILHLWGRPGSGAFKAKRKRGGKH